MINVDKIVSDTLVAFQNNKDKLTALPSISEDDYYSIHQCPLTPTSIKIDSKLFTKEIQSFDSYFYQWGNQHTHLPRYGLALVNEDGILKSNDPINGSLYEWNVKNPQRPLLETDCVVSTNVMDMESLKPLSVFNGYWCRSNILKWQAGADFKPHIDTVLPSPWIRLWATTDPSTIELNFYNKIGSRINIEPIEAGRVYIIDTSLVHDASASGLNFQLFLSVLPSAIDLLKHFTRTNSLTV